MSHLLIKSVFVECEHTIDDKGADQTTLRYMHSLISASDVNCLKSITSERLISKIQDYIKSP